MKKVMSLLLGVIILLCGNVVNVHACKFRSIGAFIPELAVHLF